MEATKEKTQLVNGVESRYEGDIDLRGFLGLSEDVPVGYKEIRVYFVCES